jgi:hypothetical protein
MIIGLGLIVAFVSSARAADIEEAFRVQRMINNRMLFDPANNLVLQSNAMSLSFEYRMMIYNNMKKDYNEDALVGLAINFFIPGGIGSFIIGDTTDGIIQLVYDTAFILFMAYGVDEYYEHFMVHNLFLGGAPVVAFAIFKYVYSIAAQLCT